MSEDKVFIDTRSLTAEDVARLRAEWAKLASAHYASEMPRIIKMFPQDNGPVKALWGIPVVEVEEHATKQNRLDGLFGWAAQLRAWVHAGIGRVRALLRPKHL